MSFQDLALCPCKTMLTPHFLKTCGEDTSIGQQRYDLCKICLSKQILFLFSRILWRLCASPKVEVDPATLSFWGYDRILNSALYL